MISDEGVVVAGVGVSIMDADRMQMVRVLVHPGIGLLNEDDSLLQLPLHDLDVTGDVASLPLQECNDLCDVILRLGCE
jgi:hypothetical protein